MNLKRSAQIVDMRWGVPEQASDNHSTTDLCIQEIKKCQEVSVGPNFVVRLENAARFFVDPRTSLFKAALKKIVLIVF